MRLASPARRGVWTRKPRDPCEGGVAQKTTPPITRLASDTPSLTVTRLDSLAMGVSENTAACMSAKKNSVTPEIAQKHQSFRPNVRGFCSNKMSLKEDNLFKALELGRGVWSRVHLLSRRGERAVFPNWKIIIGQKERGEN